MSTGADAIDITAYTTLVPSWWPEYSFGILFAILGVTGAAIMIYFGESERLVGISARILEIRQRIEANRAIANQINDPEHIDIREKWENIISRDEDRLERERKVVKRQGTILYLFIGGVIATIFANNVVEAIAFGVGWTGFVGYFGIQKDNKERRKLRSMKEEENRKETYSDFEELLTEKTTDAYYTGYSDAIEEIAEAENRTVDSIVENLK